MRCFSTIPASFSSDERTSVVERLEFFKDDLCFPSAGRAELEHWHSHFVGKELPETPQAAFEQANPLLFSNVRLMLACIVVLPVTSCEPE